MRLTGTLHVVGKVGPFDVLTEEALAGLHERIQSGVDGGGATIALDVGGELVLGTVVSATLTEIVHGPKCVQVEVDVDDEKVAGAAPAPEGIPTPDESAALERLLEERGL